MLLINSENLVSRYLTNYNIWCDYQNFYHNKIRTRAQQNSAGIPCFLAQDIESINASTHSMIAIDCLTEGLHYRNFFEQYRPGPQYLIFSNGWWDQTKIKLPIEYELVYHNFFLCEMADAYFSPNRFCFYINKSYQFEAIKPCVFISTIGNVRPQRDYLIDQLLKNLNYKNFIVRYSGQNLGIEYLHDVVSIDSGNFDPYTVIFDQYYHNISQSLPTDMYNKGHFNLVVESDLDGAHEFFLTEKTIKSLITGMPFVVVSTPYFLQHLRELGFHTYNQLWDESYDKIENFSLRVEKIVQLCNDLEKFNWQCNLKQLEEIALKNTHNFFNLNRHVEKNFIQFENILKKII